MSVTVQVICPPCTTVDEPAVFVSLVSGPVTHVTRSGVSSFAAFGAFERSVKEPVSAAPPTKAAPAI
ncbi:MAG TPA: hypothetical protein PKD07_11745 [Microthrixaceae bacterium]|nr:hypothetical protein [Microthrixaceae bacterium]